MNEIEKQLLDLIKQLPPLQVFGLASDRRVIEVSPLYAKDLSPARMDALLVTLRKLLQVAEEAAESTTEPE